MPAPLTLEQLATTMAHVAFYESAGIDAVLKQLRVEEPAYAGARAHWLDAMRGEFDDDDAPLALRFSASFEEAKTKLEEDKPKLEDVTALVEGPVVGVDFAPVDVTSATGVPALTDDVLPFEEGAAAAPRVEIILESSMTEDVGMTQTMQALDIPDDALPFEQRSPLSLTQYASLCAELRCRPDDAAAVRARYNVSTDAQLTALNEQFDEQLAADADMRAHFERLLATYVEWLQKEKPKS